MGSWSLPSAVSFTLLLTSSQLRPAGALPVSFGHAPLGLFWDFFSALPHLLGLQDAPAPVTSFLPRAGLSQPLLQPLLQGGRALPLELALEPRSDSQTGSSSG